MAKTRIDDLSVQISADTSGLAGDLRRGMVDLNDFKRSVERANRDVPTARVATREAAAHKRAAQEAGSAWRMAGGLARDAFIGVLSGGTALAGLSAMEAGLGGMADAFREVKDAVRMAADVERTAISFEVLLGTAEKARGMMAELRTFAAQTPFGAKETTDAAKNLLAFGTAADQVVPALKMLGNVTAPIMDSTSLKDMVYLFGTLQTQGRAYAQDIRQFTGRGIGIIEPLAKELGVAKHEVMQFVEEGRVGFPQVARALESLQLPGGRFSGMLDKQSQSLHGLWEQAKDAFDLLKTGFGQVIVESADLKGAVRVLV